MPNTVNFKEVAKNIKKDNLDIKLIRVEYINLTASEIKELKVKQKPIKKLDDKRILAVYPKDGKPLFQNKATTILYLGA